MWNDVNVSVLECWKNEFLIWKVSALARCAGWHTVFNIVVLFGFSSRVLISTDAFHSNTHTHPTGGQRERDREGEGGWLVCWCFSQLHIPEKQQSILWPKHTHTHTLSQNRMDFSQFKFFCSTRYIQLVVGSVTADIENVLSFYYRTHKHTHVRTHVLQAYTHIKHKRELRHK